jgi:hypothetical protein
LIISALNYSSIKYREKEERDKKRKAAEKAQEEREQVAQREAARYTTPMRESGTQTGDTAIATTSEFSG